MKNETSAPSYKRHRFPPEIIAHAVWLYFRFARSYRDVEELLAERGVIRTDETVRRWCQQFGRTDANEARRRRPRPGDPWHPDAVFVRSNGAQRYRWRGRSGRRGARYPGAGPPRKAAAAQFLHTLLKGRAYVPRVVLADTRASDGAARRAALPRVEHRQHQRSNNRAEPAHQPTRERARRRRCCKDPGHAQRFLAASGPSAAHRRPRRHRPTAAAYPQTRAARFTPWRALTGTPALA